MVQFSMEFKDFEFVKQVVSQIPWGHNILIIQRLSSFKERLWYVKKTIENDWSRSVLDTWIASDLVAALNVLAAGLAVMACEANSIRSRQQEPVGNCKKVLPCAI
jgi:hypothetical protein